MPTKSLFFLLVIVMITSIISCKKSENFVCRNPSAIDLHGVWSQDYYVDPIAFQPFPDWERIEFRQDSFFMKIVVSAEHLTALDCYLKKWNEYAKGIYTVVNDRIAFTGILTDSNYVEKISGCHENGLYNARFAIEYCESNFVMRILSADTIVAGDIFKIKMLRKNN